MRLIEPNWPLKDKVTCFSTTTEGGFSEGAFDSFNLGAHVEDEALHVRKNRALLNTYIRGLDSHNQPVIWLNQTHSSRCIRLPDDAQTITEVSSPIDADAAFTCSTSQSCAVMTADCMAVMVSSEDASEVAAIHAGWRGLADGILENSISQFSSDREKLFVWFAPCISAECFEVGEELLDCFPQYSQAFSLKENSSQLNSIRKYNMNMRLIATSKLQSMGIEQFYDANICTYSSPFLYSHRRATHQGMQTCGRMANVILINK
ncbi:peptidoglycan editing factor PgeF [Glaciecola sp. MH2013]|uniref:peptidoglycan editing factor PgeF n=1 Tax=Glaciecola sp. MH2013 TaxID=2785524 RepID=UPI001E2C36F8|nr:peptidoglycan editing factor PgeF [Glaciecola sp. MH2013]